MVVRHERPDHLGGTVPPGALERRELPLQPLVLLAPRAAVLVGVDREELRVAIFERVVVLGRRHVHVAVVVVGVLLVVADHGVEADPGEERAHAREELVHPLPLDGPLIDQIARDEQEVGPQPPDLLGEAAVHLGVALRVAHHGEGEGRLRKRRGLKGTHVSLEPGVAAVFLDEHLVVVAGLRLEPGEPGGVQEAVVARRLRLAVEPGGLTEPDADLGGPIHFAHHVDARPGGVLEVGLHQEGKRPGGIGLGRESDPRGMVRVFVRHPGGLGGNVVDHHLPEPAVHRKRFVGVSVGAEDEPGILRIEDRAVLLAALAVERAVDPELHGLAVVHAADVIPAARLDRGRAREIGHPSVAVIGPGRRQAEREAAVVVAQHPPGFGVAVVLEAGDDASERQQLVEAHQRRHGDRVGREGSPDALPGPLGHEQVFAAVEPQAAEAT